MEQIIAYIADIIEKSEIVDRAVSLFLSLVVLVLGWILAVLAAKAAETGLRKMNIRSRLSFLFPEGKPGKEKNIELWISRIIYYMLILFTVFAFLNVLELDSTARPIEHFLANITDYTANIIGASVLVIIAWLSAAVLRYITFSSMEALSIDEKLSSQIAEDPHAEKYHKLSETVPSAVYWITFLFFAPAILRALRIESIMTPVEKMFEKVFNYIPNVFSAILILVVGFFAAKIIRSVVTGIMHAAHFDVMTEKAGISKIFGTNSISKVVGLLAYVLVAIPVVITSLTALQIDALTAPLSKLLEKILNSAGDIIGAAMILVVSYVVGYFVSNILVQFLEGLGFNKLFPALGFHNTDKSGTLAAPSKAAGKLVHIGIMVFAAISACEVLGFNKMAGLMLLFVPFAGNIIISVIVFIIGIYVANLAYESIRSRNAHSDILAMVVRIAVLAFFAAIALYNMNIGSAVILTAFAIILGSVSVAFAIAFGLGGKEFAAKKLAEWNEKYSKDSKEDGK